MKKIHSYTLFFYSGILFTITAILNFIDTKTLMGITYLCLAITFTSLGFSYKKKENSNN